MDLDEESISERRPEAQTFSTQQIKLWLYWCDCNQGLPDDDILTVYLGELTHKIQKRHSSLDKQVNTADND